ncbi:MAG: hypothetical protein ACUVQK_00125 [Thermogutta sp.]
MVSLLGSYGLELAAHGAGVEDTGQPAAHRTGDGRGGHHPPCHVGLLKYGLRAALVI